MGKYTGILLCSDFDGTLYNGEFIPEENMKAIRHFRENGGLFSVVSGRDTGFLNPFFEGYSFGVPIVNYNGAVIYDFDRQKMISERFISGLTMDTIRTVLNEVEGVYRISLFQRGKVTRQNIDKSCALDPSLIEGLYKFAFNIAGDEQAHIAARDKLRELFPQYTVVRSWNDYAEILNPLSTKAPSAKLLAEMVGADTLVCVGDYENDIEMVRNADIGYAVANAVPELKSVAHRVTVSVNDAAIARIIEEL